MPREPANPFGYTLSPTGVLVQASRPLPGSGLLYVFSPRWDLEWWPAAANDEALQPCPTLSP